MDMETLRQRNFANAAMGAQVGEEKHDLRDLENYIVRDMAAK